MGVLTDINGMGGELGVLGSSSHRLTDINSRSVLNSIEFKFSRGNIGTLVDIDNNTGTKASNQTMRCTIPLVVNGAGIIMDLDGNLLAKISNTIYNPL